MKTLAFKERHYIMEEPCKVCGAVGEYSNGNGDGLCLYCGTKHCCDRHYPTCSSKFSYGGYLFPCLKEPICNALHTGDKNWRAVKPLDEVPYMVVIK